MCSIMPFRNRRRRACRSRRPRRPRRGRTSRRRMRRHRQFPVERKIIDFVVNGNIPANDDMVSITLLNGVPQGVSDQLPECLTA